jgi:hypothetical protein
LKLIYPPSDASRVLSAPIVIIWLATGVMFGNGAPIILRVVFIVIFGYFQIKPDA